jgi:hypothetical protein
VSTIQLTLDYLRHQKTSNRPGPGDSISWNASDRNLGSRPDSPDLSTRRPNPLTGESALSLVTHAQSQQPRCYQKSAIELHGGTYGFSFIISNNVKNNAQFKSKILRDEQLVFVSICFATSHQLEKTALMDPEKRHRRRHTPKAGKADPTDSRSPAQEDRDRILYTSSFRRLAQITQVIAADTSHVFHNRLTHSSQVAQVGRRLRSGCWRSIPRMVAESDGLDPDVVEAACLVHDLGHPPFGISLNENSTR